MPMSGNAIRLSPRRASAFRLAELEHFVPDATGLIGVDPRHLELASYPDETVCLPVVHRGRDVPGPIDPIVRCINIVAVHQDVPGRDLVLRPPPLPPKVTCDAIGDDPRPDIHPALLACMVRESASALSKWVKARVNGIIKCRTPWHVPILSGADAHVRICREEGTPPLPQLVALLVPLEHVSLPVEKSSCRSVIRGLYTVSGYILGVQGSSSGASD